jgi:hypothetical protein
MKKTGSKTFSSIKRKPFWDKKNRKKNEHKRERHGLK